jgi:hypothetical protein
MSLRLVSDRDGGSPAPALVGPSDPGPGGQSHPKAPVRRDSSGGLVPVGLTAVVGVTQATVCVLAITSSSWPWYWVALLIASAVMVAFALVLAERREVEALVWEQARHVYVSTQRTINSDGSLTVLARVHNRSDGPIWSVELVPRRDGQAYDGELSQTLPDVLPSMVEEWKWSVSREDAAHEERYPELVFLDASMRRWRRVGPGLEPQGVVA